MASFAIGAKLRQERVGRGLTIDDIARDTRIPPRYLQAIETEEFSDLPGLVFTRNFVRQYALTLKLDPDPLLAELPTQDESTVQLPNPPEHRQFSYRRDRMLRSFLASVVWLLIAGVAGIAAYIHFNRPPRVAPPRTEAASAPATPAAAKREGVTAETPVKTPEAGGASGSATQALAAPVEVSMTAHAAAWIQVTADGRTAFIGTLQPNETKQVSAAEQVKISTGNAGALTISLNGKTLDSLGPIGQVRTVRLTAEGPELLSKAPQLALDPL